ncbi:MAG TPA: arylsulfatase [Tissierellaceae bacterium]|nr:arylsulfatase [Tissierellaceae bacterium]
MSMKKPNVIMIFMDDLGIGDISSFNEESKINTERIDELASSGMKFTNSHASSSLCTPSRYGLLTGRYNWRSRLKHVVCNGDSEALIEKDRMTLADLFKNQGYKTAAVGKWHLGIDWHYTDGIDYEKYGISQDTYNDGRDLTIQNGRDGIFDQKYRTHLVEGIDIDYSKPIKYGPNDYGFDYFFGTAASLDQAPYVYIENDRVTMEPTKVTGVAGLNRQGAKQQEEWELGVIADNYNHQKCPEVLQEKVLELIDEYSESHQPFFIYYPTHLVHGPILPDEKDQGKSQLGIYGDFVMQADRYVGEIVDRLKEKEIFEDTIIIFTSDNGVSAVSDIPYLLSKGHNSSNRFRGQKGTIWEGGHREPTLVTYPKLIKAGSVSDELICHTDIFSTFADFFGYEIPDNVAEDSISNLSIWQGSNDQVRDDIVHSCGNGGLSIRTNEWKLNFVRDGGGAWNDEGSFGPAELFRIDVDNEHFNIIDENPEVVDKLTLLLEEYIKNGRSTKGKKQHNERNNPDGHWEQISWMSDYEEYIEEFSPKSK